MEFDKKGVFWLYDMFNISQRESSTGFLNRKKLNIVKNSKGKFLRISHARTSTYRSLLYAAIAQWLDYVPPEIRRLQVRYTLNLLFTHEIHRAANYQSRVTSSVATEYVS